MDFVKERLSTCPVLKAPVWDQPFFILPSADERVVASALMQYDYGRAHPNYYAS
jgi:hypothetical protein